MKAIDRAFTKIINGTTQFVIAFFQRDCTWTEMQCEELGNDELLTEQLFSTDYDLLNAARGILGESPGWKFKTGSRDYPHSVT